MQSATLFREAAGVYHHLANELLPSLQSSLPVERPPEVNPSVSTAMNLICLAEAQVIYYLSVIVLFVDIYTSIVGFYVT